jgi:hypothetical protein
MFRDDFDPQDIFRMFFSDVNRSFSGGHSRGGVDMDDLINNLIGGGIHNMSAGPRRRGNGGNTRVFQSPMGSFVFSSGGFGPGFQASFSTGGFNGFP